MEIGEFIEVEHIKIRARAGVVVTNAIRDGLALSLREGAKVEMEFNGTPLLIDAGNTIHSIVTKWELARREGGE